jgi:hypothetical protein
VNYQEADAKLTGRNKQSRKLENNTYVERGASYLEDKVIVVRLHRTNIITFHPDGRIGICNGGYPTCTTHDRLNTYLPRPYRVHGEPVQTQRSSGGATVLSDGNGNEVLLDNKASISAEGELDGGDVTEYRKQRREERNAENRVRNRARYWVRKARGIYVDRSQCKVERWKCNTVGRWNRRNLREGTYECGCRTYIKPATYNGTVESILQEENQTVRVAKMTCYGLEKFFLDAKAAVVDEKAGYQLLELPLDSWQRVRALKMTCPSTGVVYINSVPPTINEVPVALNWMFDTTDYLGTVAQQS